jgi:X-domain of DnaJ-containing
MAIYLIEKITAWVSVSMELSSSKTNGNKTSTILDDIENTWKIEASELSTASYGYQMVTTIGKIYNLLALVYDGSFDSGQGLPGIHKWAKRHKAGMDTKRAKTQVCMDTIKLNIDMIKLQIETQDKIIKASTDEERTKIIAELQDLKSSLIVRVLWTTVVIDITSSINEATQMVVFDQSVDKRTRKYRSKAIQKLGDIWMNAQDPNTFSASAGAIGFD